MRTPHSLCTKRRCPGARPTSPSNARPTNRRLVTHVDCCPRVEAFLGLRPRNEIRGDLGVPAPGCPRVAAFLARYLYSRPASGGTGDRGLRTSAENVRETVTRYRPYHGEHGLTQDMHREYRVAHTVTEGMNGARQARTDDREPGGNKTPRRQRHHGSPGSRAAYSSKEGSAESASFEDPSIP